MQDVAADLVAPASLDVFAPQLEQLGLVLLHRSGEESGLEQLGGRLLVLGLRAFILALGDDPGGNVGQPHGRVRLVHVLTAGPGRAEGVHPDLVPVEFDLDVALHLGQDLDESERRVTALLRVEGADADEPVNASFGLEEAVGRPTIDRNGHALHAGLLALGLVEDLGGEAVPLGPAQIHAQQHLGPVCGLGAAGAGAYRQQGVAAVVLAAEEQLASGGGVLTIQFGRFPGHVLEQARVALVLGELEQLQCGSGAGFEGAPQGQLLANSTGNMSVGKPMAR